MIERGPVRPSLAWLGAAVAVALAGIAGAAVLLVLLIRDVDDPMLPLYAPVTVRLDAGEGRGIWAYTEAPVRGTCGARGPGRVQMQDTSGVSIRKGGRQYHSFLRFEAPRAGTYEVRCSTDEPLALGPHVSGLRLFAGIAGILASFFGGLLGAGGIVAVVLILRERSRRRLETAGG